MIKIKSISKRVLAVLLATLMLLTSGIVGTLAANVDFAETGAYTELAETGANITVTLDENGKWSGKSGHILAWAWASGGIGKWHQCTSLGNNQYSFSIDSTRTNIKFVKATNDVSTSNWNDAGTIQYQTGNLTIPSNTKTFQLTSTGGGSWIIPKVVGGNSDISLRGAFNSWSETANIMTYEDSTFNTVVTTVNNLSSGSTTLKLVVNGSWTGKDGKYTFNTTSDTSLSLSNVGSGNDVTLVVGETGNYVFTYNISANKLSVKKLANNVTATFSYWKDGSTVTDEVEVAEGNVPKAPTPPTRVDYDFAGWSTDPNATTGSETVSAISDDTTFYAIYTLKKFTVTFNTDDGSSVAPQSVGYGSKVTKPADPTKTATAEYTYTFSHWAINGSKVDFNTYTVTGNVTLTAVYTKTLRTYTVTFMANDKVISTQPVEYGKYATAPDASTIPAPTGHVFREWDKSVTGTQIKGDTTFTAQYDPEEYDYTLTIKTFDTDGTTITEDSGCEVSGYDSNKVSYGQSITLTAKPSTLYMFNKDSGWTVTGTCDYVVNDNGTLTISNIASNITVEAQFKKLVTRTITIKQSGYDTTKNDTRNHSIKLDGVTKFENAPEGNKNIVDVLEGEHTIYICGPFNHYIAGFKVNGDDVMAQAKKDQSEWVVSYTFNVTADTDIEVVYHYNPTITIKTNVDGVASSNLYTDVVCNYNGTKTIKLSEKPGYYISGIEGLGSYDFTNGTDTNLRSKSITLSKVTEDVVATVYYKDLPTFTVTVNADTTKGSVSPAVGTHDYEPGTTVNFTANPISGYYTEWYVNGTKQTKGNTFTYIVNSNVTVEAKFCPQQWDCVLFVKKDNKWSDVYAYVWKSGGGSELLGGFPGTKMELIDETNKVYAIYINVSADQIENYKLILSNGSKSGQTKDLAFVKGSNYYTLSSGTWSYSDREYTPTKYVYGVNGSVITDVDQGNYGNAKYKGQVEFRAQTSLSNIDDTDEYYVKAQWDGVNTVDIYTTVVHSDFKVDGWVINGTKFVSADKTTVANEFRGTIPVAYLYEIENDAVAVYSHSEAWRNAHPEIGTVTLFADISQVSDITAYNWGEYISAYTWNQKDTSNGDKWGDGGYEQFGEWEGQLMIPVGDERSGVFYTVVEKKGVLPNYTNDVMGITFTNFGGHSPCNNSVGFLQTYDYYEFIKLQDKDNIMFVLQPTDNTSNKDTISSNFIGYTKKTSANNLDAFGTFDYLTDYDGIVMDIYRDHLTDVEIEANDVGLYVVRTGPYDSGSTDKNSVNIDGQYYIDCFVYDKDRKFIGRCKSFELLDLESLVAKNPDFAVLTDESTKANFEGKLVKVAYEYPDYIKDNATRVDGEWYGVDNTKTITLTTRVAELTKEGVIVADSNKAEYGSASIDGKEIWEGPVSTEQLLGSVNRSSEYKFVGWYHGKLDDNGNVTVDEDEPKISSNTDAKFTPYQSGYFVAVFEELASGTFTVNNYSYIVDLDAPGQPPVYNKLGLDASYRYVKIDKIDENGNVIEPGVKSDQKPADEAYYSTINVTEDDILKITIYTIPKYTETDKVYAWYMKTTEADGTYNYEEVGTEEIKKFGVGEEATFTFTYVITEDYQKSLTIYSDVLTKTAEITLDYRYINRYHHEKSYTKSYTLIGEELANNRPSDDAIRANAPYVNDLYKDVRWVISEIKADETGARFILEAQYDELIEVNVSVMGQTVDTITGKFNEAHSLYATDYDDDANPVTNKGFWYVELGDEGDGEFTEGVDAILSYGTYYGLVFTEDMDINYVTTESLDFKVILNAPIYGREQATGVDMVYTDFIINYLVPYFSGEPVVEGGKPVFDVENKNAPIQLDIYAEAAGVTVEYGMVHQLINTYNPDAALNDQNLTDYFNTNPLSENEIKAFENFLNKCKETGKTSGMDSTGQLFNYKYTGKNDLTNKNRALMTFITNNSEANRNKYFTAIAYLAITDANGDTKYYFSNVELFNIKDFVENNKGSDIVE